MRQFNYFANGGPFPGTCLSCGNNKELYDLGKDEQTNSSHLLCTRCIGELATTTGYTLRSIAMREAEHLKAHNKELESQLKAVPAQIEGLIDGIRNNVANFVLAVSSSDDSNNSKAVQDDPTNGSGAARPRKTENSNNKAPSKSASQ
jgi:hypothetical protein